MGLLSNARFDDMPKIKNKIMILENTNQVSDNENFDIEEQGGDFTVEDISEEKETESDKDSVKEENKKDNFKTKEKTENTEKHFVISKTDLMLVRRLVRNIKENNEKLSQVFHDLSDKGVDIDGLGKASIIDDAEVVKPFSQKDRQFTNFGDASIEDNSVVEGYFDGIGMMGPDGRQYSVPYNYSSKSKLIEGDMMKLTITPKGSFVYKQIQPAERVRIVAMLNQEDDGTFTAILGERKWKVLLASISYFKGEPGDEVIVLIPKGKESKWAAIENIIKR